MEKGAFHKTTTKILYFYCWRSAVNNPQNSSCITLHTINSSLFINNTFESIMHVTEIHVVYKYAWQMTSHPYVCNRQVLFLFIFLLWWNMYLSCGELGKLFCIFLNIPKLSVTKCLMLLGICVFSCTVLEEISRSHIVH